MSISGSETSHVENHSRAVAAIQRGQRHHHRASEALRRGQREVAFRDLDQAIEAYTECIQFDPKNLTGYTYRARAYELKGEDSLAEADLDMARALESR